MKVEFFREALSIARSKNFQESADEQYVSQASLSRHIRALENALGVELFSRLNPNVQLTIAGEVAMPYMERMVALYDEMLSEITSMRRPGKEIVNVGYSNTARITGVMKQIMNIYEESPDTEIKLLSVEDRQIQRMIAQSKLDVGCVSQYEYEMAEKSRIAHIHLTTDRLQVIVPPGHRLCGQQTVSVNDLRNEHIIMFREHYAINELFFSLCRQAGFEADVILYTTNCSDVNRLVASRLGLGIHGSSTVSIGMPGNETLGVSAIREDTGVDYYMLYNDRNCKKVVRKLVERLNDTMMTGG